MYYDVMYLTDFGLAHWEPVSNPTDGTVEAEFSRLAAGCCLMIAPGCSGKPLGPREKAESCGYTEIWRDLCYVLISRYNNLLFCCVGNGLTI